MLRTIIVEDEHHCLERLQRLIQDYSGRVEVIGHFSSVNTAMEGIQKQQPDLVFMDVELIGGTCFDILKTIQNPNFEIIFTTAHNKYAIQAFKYSAIHYLLKPLDSDEFQEAMTRVLDKFESLKTNERLESMIQNLMVRSFHEKSLAFRSTKGYKFLKPGEIVRFESEGNYCTLYLHTGTSFLVLKSIQYYETFLDPETFFRVHRFHLINLSFVTQLKDLTNSILLSNKEEIPISVRKKRQFFQLLSENGQL